MSNNPLHQLLHTGRTHIATIPSPVLGAVCALLATICWSFNFIAGRGFAHAIPPMTLVAIRGAIALLVLLPFALPHIKREWQHIRPRMGFLITISLLGMGIPQTFIYEAAYTSSALNMSIISISTPLFVLLLARIFYHELLSSVRIAGLLITILGILTLISKGNLSALLHLQFQAGDLYMLGNASSFAVYTLLLRKNPNDVSLLSFMTIFTALGTLVVLPGAAWELAQGGKISLSPMLVGGILYTSLGATLLAFGLWTLAVKYAGATKASIIYYSMPLFSGLEGLLLLGEPFLPVHAISMALIMTGLIMALHMQKTPPRAAAA